MITAIWLLQIWMSRTDQERFSRPQTRAADRVCSNHATRRLAVSPTASAPLPPGRGGAVDAAARPRRGGAVVAAARGGGSRPDWRRAGPPRPAAGPPPRPPPPAWGCAEGQPLA